MRLIFDQTIYNEFKELLIKNAPSGQQKEQMIQDYLEEHSELIPTNNLLNHHLHFSLIISKYKLSKEYTTDYTYITKSSDKWRITFVELEKPEKLIFTSDKSKTLFSAEFNAAINQVRNWKTFINENKDEVLRQLRVIMEPGIMKDNPVEFNYTLIYGRSSEKNISLQRKQLFNEIQKETDYEIMTYDQLLGYYEKGPIYKKNVISFSGFQIEFKKMHIEPDSIFSYLSPGQIKLSSDQRTTLINKNYEIERWENGEFLSYNGKYVDFPKNNKAVT